MAKYFALCCGQLLSSEHVHDFVTCDCGKTSVDGGDAYSRVLFQSIPPVPASREAVVSRLRTERFQLDVEQEGQERVQQVMETRQQTVARLETLLQLFAPETSSAAGKAEVPISRFDEAASRRAV